MYSLRVYHFADLFLYIRFWGGSCMHVFPVISPHFLLNRMYCHWTLQLALWVTWSLFENVLQAKDQKKRCGVVFFFFFSFNPYSTLVCRKISEPMQSALMNFQDKVLRNQSSNYHSAYYKATFWMEYISPQWHTMSILCFCVKALKKETREPSKYKISLQVSISITNTMFPLRHFALCLE